MVRCWFLTAEAWVQSYVICGVKCGNGYSLSAGHFTFPLSIIIPPIPIFIYHCPSGVQMVQSASTLSQPLIQNLAGLSESG